MDIIDKEGRRLYFTAEERRQFMAAAFKAPRQTRSLCYVLHYTGCRISEALALKAQNIDLDGMQIVFESLKKRKRGVFRAVPIPPDLADTLDMVHGIREAQRRGAGNERLWTICRPQAFRQFKAVVAAAGIPDGPHCSPKGLRHGFAIHAIGQGIPLNMVQRWLGHAQMTTTAIYANAVGAEEQAIAARLWT